MDQRTLQNWQKVREALERAGKTDCLIYRRALAITTGGKDPGPFGTNT
jgi:hypothetical protein